LRNIKKIHPWNLGENAPDMLQPARHPWNLGENALDMLRPARKTDKHE
jgi:hypothetical protein